MFRFAHPWLLILLPVAAAAAWAMARRKRTADARLALPRGVARARSLATGWIRIEQLLPWLRGAVLLMVVLGLARPQSGAREETVTSEGVDIVVTLDVSGSMRAEDSRSVNRLDAAKRVVTEFVRGRPSDRIGLVSFSGLAATRCPLTLDHEMLLELLGETDFTAPEQDGTAIGMGLGTALGRLRSSPARGRVAVLVTDGRNNRGQIAPQTAAEMAKTMGVRVYTVGVGQEGESRVPVDTPLGRRYMWQRLDLDETLLRSMASVTGGKYFRAADQEGLRAVFATIDSLEKTRRESRIRVHYTERFPWFLVPAAVLLLLERVLGLTRLRRIP